MTVTNYIKLEFPSCSSNESFARAAAAGLQVGMHFFIVVEIFIPRGGKNIFLGGIGLRRRGKSHLFAVALHDQRISLSAKTVRRNQLAIALRGMRGHQHAQNLALRGTDRDGQNNGLALVHGIGQRVGDGCLPG